MLENIRSDFFLKFLCQHIKDKDKILRLFQYNKCLQEKVKLSINDYKNKYYQTIIEIKPGETKSNIREMSLFEYQGIAIIIITYILMTIKPK